MPIVNNNPNMDLVDNFMEDEAERQRLLTKPTCFLVVGRPGVGKSTLAKEIAETWGCILIDDTDLLNYHIKTRTEDGIKLLDILNAGESVPEDMVLRLIIDMLNSVKAQHYGYVLSCLPFISEENVAVNEQMELIRNLKLTPDFIINIKCADKDLVQRLSGQKQHPETGLMYSQDRWKCDSDFHVIGSIDEKDEGQEDSEEEEEEEEEDEQTPKITIDQLVWAPAYHPRNTSLRINTYKDTILRPLEDYMMDHNPIYLFELDGSDKPEALLLFVLSRLGSMAIQRVSIPVVLHQDKELPEDIDTEDLLRFMSSTRMMVPGFRWRRSRWGRICPVALKEGRFLPGKPEYSVGFQDKLYILSSQEAFEKFMTNPRRYLLPPMPSPPCRVCIIGIPQSGRSALAKLMAERHKVSVLEVEALVEPLLSQLEQERLDKIKEDGLQAAIEKISLKEQSDQTSGTDDKPAVEVTEDHPEVKALLQSTLEEAKQSIETDKEIYSLAVNKIITENEEANAKAELGMGWVLDNFPKNVSQLESLERAGIHPDFLFCLMYNEGEKTSPDTEQQKAEKVLFTREWEGMQLSLSISHSVLEAGNRSPEELLDEIVQLMEKPFKFLPREFSAVDLDEETEDIEAMANLDDDDEDSFSKDTDEEEDEGESESSGDVTPKRAFGETYHFCPVVLQRQNTLMPSIDEIAARYREKVYYFSSVEAREDFILNPEEFVARTELLKPPALRIFLLGCRGSGKTTQGEWLAKKLGLFHVQFREQLQMLLVAKTKERAVNADESTEEHLDALKATIKEALGEEDVETTNESFLQDGELAEEEISIKAYLVDGIPLSQHVLEKVLNPYWKTEPFMSTGFILEGFPLNTEEVHHVLQYQLFPDVVVTLTAEVSDIQTRLLPKFWQRWKEHCDRREALLDVLREMNRKTREDNIEKRRADLMEEKGVSSLNTAKAEDEDGDGDGDGEGSNIEDEIEAILEEEFPLEGDDEFRDEEETEEATDDRLSMEIEERYVTDTNNIASVLELVAELNIPRISINASRKTQIVRRQLVLKVEPLFTNRESLFQRCLAISYNLSQQLLLYSYKFHSAFGCLDPVRRYNERDIIQPLLWPLDGAYPVLLNQYIYFLESKKNQQTFMLNPLKYLRQTKPSPTLPVKMAIIGPPKSGKTGVAQMLSQKYGLDLLSIGGVMRRVLDTQDHSDLATQMKEHLHEGLAVPDELAIQCLELVLMSMVCCTQGYVLDGFPMTMKQAQLMQSHSIIPMIMVEIEMGTVEVLKRGLASKMEENKPHLAHDSTAILHIRNTCYTQEAENMRQHFRQQYDNLIPLDGLKSKWYMWETLIKEISTSMKYIHTYLKRTRSGQAGCINKLCVTPMEFQRQLGEFGQYCPVCLALDNHIVDCSETPSLMYAAEYKRHYFKMCDTHHLEIFLSTPDQFITPDCPRPLPELHLLPQRLTEADVKDRSSQQFEMEGFCPVTYLDGKQRYEALVRGSSEYAVEYRERIYACETKQKQYKFLSAPELYWNLQLPSKVPPLCEPIPLTCLPTLGYLEQGVAVSVIKAMTAVGCLKPKFPFYSMERSALHYVAFYMKAFNHRSTVHIRQMYKKKLASFEESCTLIPYLSSLMKAPYKFPSEQPIDFEFKLNKFLALNDSPEDETEL
ncbi:adenylate kinase 9-like isoform X1 [Entelurus aequoreus]|uniref:adenylate kinase 9-like isoform X1 n=2 Tax=Entelurus aequoreus TaxID=161455 RepID=UPI002B1D2CA8|nr:adenylate kinase 9-like isoform X1 [Entelurus aequoreus]